MKTYENVEKRCERQPFMKRFFSKLKSILSFLIMTGLLCCVLVFIWFCSKGYLGDIIDARNDAKEIVESSKRSDFRQNQSTVFYDNNYDVVYISNEGGTVYLSYDQIPEIVVKGLVSIEDKNFWKHNGVDPKALLRAAVALVKNKGVITQGGSTITQQLVKNMYLTQEKTWSRKIKEIFISLYLEDKYTKQDILEFYLNSCYYANGYYGIESASVGYFNKDVSELTVSEVAFLLAIPNSPSYYDPVEHKENTIERRDLILKNMYADGCIDKSEYDKAKSQTIELYSKNIKLTNINAGGFINLQATRALMLSDGFKFKTSFKNEAELNDYTDAYDEAYEYWNERLHDGGYRVYTSIDVNAQKTLQASMDNVLKDFTEVSDEGIYTLQSGAVCIDNSTGMVTAIIGGRSQDGVTSSINRAYQCFRQPGSTIKPVLVYTPAIDILKMNSDTIVDDKPIENGPKNAWGYCSGRMKLRTAVATSVNTVPYLLYEQITPQVGISYLKKMGFSKITKDDERTLSCALGGFTYGVSPLEMCKAYATIANDGKYREATCIKKICDAEGNVIYKNEQTETQVYTKDASRIMTDMLTSVIKEGTAKGRNIGDMPCAAKTGTTNDNKDGWFVGYTPYYTTSVYVGYDVPKTVPGLGGGTYPGQIWQDFMLVMNKDLEVKWFWPET